MSTIGVDLDGVVYQFHSAWAYMLRTYRGVVMPPENQWQWDTPDVYGSEEDREWLWTEGVRLGLFRYGHIEKGAIVGLRALSEKHEVVAVTHRPRVAVPDTLAFLSYANLPWSGVHILSEKQPKTSVAWDVLIDDKPENIEDAVHHARAAVLFKQPWNQHYGAKYRANWTNMEETIDRVLRPR